MSTTDPAPRTLNRPTRARYGQRIRDPISTTHVASGRPTNTSRTIQKPATVSLSVDNRLPNTSKTPAANTARKP